MSPHIAAIGIFRSAASSDIEPTTLPAKLSLSIKPSPVMIKSTSANNSSSSTSSATRSKPGTSFAPSAASPQRVHRLHLHQPAQKCQRHMFLYRPGRVVQVVLSRIELVQVMHLLCTKTFAASAKGVVTSHATTNSTPFKRAGV